MEGNNQNPNMNYNPNMNNQTPNMNYNPNMNNQNSNYNGMNYSQNQSVNYNNQNVASNYNQMPNNQQNNYNPNIIDQNQVEELAVESPKEEKPKKSNKLLIIILILIVLAVAGYFIYTKFMAKDEPKEPVKEPEQTKPVEEDKDKVEYIKELVKVVPVNGKEVKLTFKYFIQNWADGNDETGDYGHNIEYDLFLEDQKVATNYAAYISKEPKDELTPEQFFKDEANVAKLEEAMKVDSVFGLIQGDKEYLYIKEIDSGVYETANIVVFDEFGNKILTENMYNTGRTLALDKTCQNYDKFGNTKVYITNNAIYFLEDKGGCTDELLVPQYKITFSNNKANREKIADCKVTAEGSC